MGIARTAGVTICAEEEMGSPSKPRPQFNSATKGSRKPFSGEVGGSESGNSSFQCGSPEPRCRPTELETLGVWPSNLWHNAKFSRWF